MQPGLAIVLAAVLLALATALGLLWKRRQGRISHVSADRGSASDLVRAYEARYVLVQLSTEYCSPCKTAARVLSDVASRRPDVAHVEFDLSEHPSLLRRFHVTQAPTTVIVDRAGTPRARFVGAPTALAVEQALDDLTDQEAGHVLSR